MPVDQQEVMTRKLNTESHAKAMAKLDALIERAAAWTGGFFAVNYCAPHGYAKSMLLVRVWETYQGRIPASRVALKDFVTVGEPLDRVKLLGLVLYELIFRLSPQIVEESGIPTSYVESTAADEMATWIVSLVKAVAHFERVSLLLLDDYDVLPAADRRWFEFQVLGQLERGCALRCRHDQPNTTALRPSGSPRRAANPSADAPDCRGRRSGFPTIPRSISADRAAYRRPAHVNRRTDRSARRVAAGGGRATGAAKRLDQEVFQRARRESDLRRCPPGPTKNPRGASAPSAFRRAYSGSPVTQDAAGRLHELRDVQIRGPLGRAEHVDTMARRGRLCAQPGVCPRVRGYVMAERSPLWQKVHRESRDHYRSLLATGQYQRHYLVEALFHRLSLLQVEGVSIDDQQKTVNGDLLAAVQAEATRAAIVADAGLLRDALRHDSDLGPFISEEALNRLTELEQRSLATGWPLSLGHAA